MKSWRTLGWKESHFWCLRGVSLAFDSLYTELYKSTRIYLYPESHKSLIMLFVALINGTLWFCMRQRELQSIIYQTNYWGLYVCVFALSGALRLYAVFLWPLGSPPPLPRLANKQDVPGAVKGENLTSQLRLHEMKVWGGHDAHQSLNNIWMEVRTHSKQITWGGGGGVVQFVFSPTPVFIKCYLSLTNGILSFSIKLIQCTGVSNAVGHVEWAFMHGTHATRRDHRPLDQIR